MNSAVIVMVKELRESLRDRRTLINTFVVGPLLGPLLFVLLLKVIVDRELSRAQQPLPVAVIGAEYAPNLVAALRQAGVEIKPAVSDAERAVREQRVELVLRIAESFASEWRAGQPAQLELIYDSSRRETNARVERLQRMLEAYSARGAALRLMLRGQSPTLLRPIVVAERDQSTPQSRSALLFAMLPYLLIFAALFGGMFLAIDATAGERERQSLEPLLANPVPRARILQGKLAATATFSATSVLLSLLAFAVAARFMPGDELGMELSLDARFFALVLPLLVPLVLLFSTAQTMVAAHARSFREAQTWLGLLQLIPIIPSVLLSFWPLNPPDWMYAIPLAGQQFSLLRLLRGESLTALQVLGGMISTLLLAWLVYRAALHSYQSERLAVSA